MHREFIESPEAAERSRAQVKADAESRAAKVQADEEAREAREAREAAARRTSLDHTLRERFLSAGGSVEEYERQRESLIQDHIRAQTLAGDSEARRVNAARYAN